MKVRAILSRKTRVARLVAATFVLSFAAAMIGWAATRPNQTMWHDMGGRPFDPAARRLVDSSVHRTVRLDKAALAQALAGAPMEFSREAAEHLAVIYLPMPDGAMARFRFEESPIMEAALALRHPEIKTYSGQGMDDPTATARFDWTPLGLHAIVLSGEGATFIEPVSSSDTTTYVSYFNRDVSMDRVSLSCLLSEAEIAEAEQRGVYLNQGGVSPAFVTGSTLRTYRLAVAATGEFTQQYGGGNVNTTLARITTLINQVDAVYRREATISFQLVANETSIIFTDPATDGYTNDSPSTMLAENQTKLTAVIGSANYDIGHVFGGITVGPGSVSFSGIASIGVVCASGSKARGATTMGGGSASFPHSIFVSGVTHEIGHQFSARHTFNSTTGGCAGQRDGSSAYEPGSGSTIMGYSTCGADNLQNFPDLYFHTGSLEQIVTYAAGSGNCAAMTATGNAAPSIATLTNFTIPANTPFTLTGSVTDPNGDALTCVWEEFDSGAASPPNNDDGTRPIFRSFTPTQSTSRTFPRLQYILNNANVPPPTTGGFLTGEVLPSTARTMNFRFTARDNRAAGGGAANAPMQMSVVSAAGPFAVMLPNTPVSWPSGSAQLVSWNVAGTANAPINCANVKISLSTDGGNTFPITLAASTPNDGSETVVIPSLPSTTTARVRVEAVGNVFFDISDTNFTITGGGGATPTPTPPSGFPVQFGNISTRLRIELGDNALIGGFIISGTQPKRVIVRAIGPSLASFGIVGAISDTVLELRNSSGALIAFNDDWQSDQQAEIIGTGLAPSHIWESAIVTTLPANNSAYTAVVRGYHDATGIGVVEAYDLDRATNSKLANISTRGFVNTGDDVMIGGLIIVGNTTANVLIRAIGPSLENFGVPNALPDPTLELYDGNGTLLAFNDDWQSDQQAAIIATGLAPTHIRESAIVRGLSPGAYTAIVREYNNLTGVALVEGYQLP
jgi:hypothetical protein